MTKEKKFENKIKDYLKEHDSYFIKYWGGGEFTKSGIPDILSCVNGRFIGIEVKSETGRPSALQLYNLEKIDDAGGIGILVFPKDWTLFKSLIDCVIENDIKNLNYNYDIFKRNIEEWEERLDI